MEEGGEGDYISIATLSCYLVCCISEAMADCQGVLSELS